MHVSFNTETSLLLAMIKLAKLEHKVKIEFIADTNDTSRDCQMFGDVEITHIVFGSSIQIPKLEKIMRDNYPGCWITTQHYGPLRNESSKGPC